MTGGWNQVRRLQRAPDPGRGLRRARGRTSTCSTPPAPTRPPVFGDGGPTPDGPTRSGDNHRSARRARAGARGPRGSGAHAPLAPHGASADLHPHTTTYGEAPRRSSGLWSSRTSSARQDTGATSSPAATTRSTPCATGASGSTSTSRTSGSTSCRGRRRARRHAGSLAARDLLRARARATSTCTAFFRELDGRLRGVDLRRADRSRATTSCSRESAAAQVRTDWLRARGL